MLKESTSLYVKDILLKAQAYICTLQYLEIECIDISC